MNQITVEDILKQRAVILAEASDYEDLAKQRRAQASELRGAAQLLTQMQEASKAEEECAQQCPTQVN